MLYLLDTNIIAYLIKKKNLKLIDKFKEISSHSKIGISSITFAEIYYVLEKKGSEKL